MKHLTDEQLGARLDGELPSRDAEAAERHLAECEACRERLAALAGADAALSRALDRDPGEAYFASFADRVQARIAAGAAAEPAREPVAAPAPGRSWFARPAVLAWAGAAAALAVVGVFAVQFANQNAAGGRATLAREESVVGADVRESRAAATPQAAAPELSSGPAADAAAPAEPQARSAPPQAAAPAPEAGAAARERRMSRELADRGPAASTPAPAPVRPQRAQELRTLENGEQVPITRDAPPVAKQKTFATAPAGEATKPTRMPALPMSPAPATAEKRMDAVPEAPIAQKSSARLQLGAPVPQASAPATPPPPPPPAAGGVAADEGAASLQANEVTAFRACGRVTDPSGRPIAGATVTVVETGASASADADGRWCVSAPAPRATLSVLAVGFRETRAVLRDDANEPLALRLAPVSALGGSSLPVARLGIPPAPGTAPSESEAGRPMPGFADRVGRALAMKSAAPRTPAVAGETPDMQAAREATDAALRARTAAAWTRAGTLWSAAAASAPAEALGRESLYRAAEARVSAWRLARGDANRRAALDALEAFLARAPAGAQRDSAEKWRKELPER